MKLNAVMYCVCGYVFIYFTYICANYGINILTKLASNMTLLYD